MKKQNIFIILVVMAISCQKVFDVNIIQENGNLVGQIEPVILDALVELYQGGYIDETGVDEDGYFRFDDIKPGTYMVRVSAEGYGTAEDYSNHVTGGETYDCRIIYLDPYPNPLYDIYFSGGSTNTRVRQTSYFMRLNFRSDMDLQSIVNGIIFDPPIPNLTVRDYSSYNSRTFTIDGDLDYNTNYTFILDTTISTIAGAALEFPFAGEFQTEKFEITEINVGDSPYGYNRVRIEFSGEVPYFEVSSNITINPFTALEYQNSISHYFYLTPEVAWMSDTTISVHLSNNITEMGGAKLDRDTTFSFTTAPMFVTRTTPYDQQYFVPVESDIIIYMNTVVDESTISSAVTIVPDIGYEISTSLGSYSRIILNPYTLISGMEYTVTIDTALTDYYGVPMKENFSFEFFTQ